MKKLQRVLLKNEALMSRSHHVTHELLTGPPPEVLDEIAAAWERAQAPLPEGLVLDFASEPALARAWGELRLADGTLVTGLSACEAVAIACGDAAVLTAAAMAV
jgi:hypothetical protein